MNELELLRKQIDEIDDEICKLFEKRMKVAKSIGDFKKENNMNVLDSSREEKVLENQLEGYIEYKKKVKYRLIPFIW